MENAIGFKNLIGIALYYLSRLVPRKKDVIVFGSNNGNSMGDNPKYIYNILRENPNFKCVWILHNADAVKELSSKGIEAYYFKSKEGIKYQLTSKYFVHSHSINDDFYRIFLGGGISFNTWHGVGVKKIWAANPESFIYQALHTGGLRGKVFRKYVKTNQAKETYIFCTSPTMVSHFTYTFLLDETKLPIMGQARNDVFFDESLEDRNVPQWYKDEKVILYMPTHRNRGEDDRDINEVLDFSEIDRICSEKGYKFVVKAHMFSNIGDIKGYKNIANFSTMSYDSQTLLKYADVLVTDYSSAYSDYLMLDRPEIFYCYDLEWFQKQSNAFYFDYLKVTPGPKVRTFGELCAALGNIEKADEDYRRQRKEILNMYYSPEVCSPVAKKQAEFILNYIDNDK